LVAVEIAGGPVTEPAVGEKDRIGFRVTNALGLSLSVEAKSPQDRREVKWHPQRKLRK
jgi:hypothetical protein